MMVLPPKVDLPKDDRNQSKNPRSFAPMWSTLTMEKFTLNGIPARRSAEAGSAMGIELGFAAANQISQAMGNSQSTNSMQSPGNVPGATVTPPPLPGEINFFVALNGRQAGPFPLAELTNMARAGQFDRSSLVWAQGMAAWEKAGEVALLQALFESLPPPLPGA